MRRKIKPEALTERARLARNLRHILALREYTNASIAEAMGRSRQWVFGVWQTPTEGQLRRIAEALEVPWELVEGAESIPLEQLRG